MAGQAGPTLYAYDDIYQLTGADHPETTSLTDETYTYDKVGNRLTTAATTGSWLHNQNNELTDSTIATYRYDENGNTVEKTENGVVTTYLYNSRNRLETVLVDNIPVAGYSYDPFGRRVSKVVTGTGSGTVPVPLGTTYYLYNDEGLIGEYSSSGVWQKSYGWQPDGLWGTDPLYMRDGSGVYYYHNDHFGTPQRLSDATTGAVAWSAGYAAFGEATIDPLSTVENNLRFPGQYYDAETGLHYNWMRTYDPKVGRYFSLDPLGANINNYLYTKNRPMFFIDQYGLIECAEFLTNDFNHLLIIDVITSFALHLGSSASEIVLLGVELVHADLRRDGVYNPAEMIGNLGPVLMTEFVETTAFGLEGITSFVDGTFSDSDEVNIVVKTLPDIRVSANNAGTRYKDRLVDVISGSKPNSFLTKARRFVGDVARDSGGLVTENMRELGVEASDRYREIPR